MLSRNKLSIMGLLVLASFSAPVLSAKPSVSMQYFRLYDDGGEHIASACEKMIRLPKILSKTQLKTKLKSYLGSEQIEFAEKNEAAIDAYQHYFSSAVECSLAAKQLQKSYESQ